jgi:hypothetical protein
VKTPPIALLNSIGFTNIAQKILYAATLLKAATVSSPAVAISPAIPTVVAKPEVIAQTAKPARPASSPVEAVRNTTGYGFGELYLNSPAYPIGTAIPAIPAKPASAAVVGVPAVVGTSAIAAVNAPAITKVAGWENSVSIAVNTSNIHVGVYLPYASSPSLIGAQVDSILEFTQTALQPLLWLDAPASSIPETITTEPATLEAYIWKYFIEANAIKSGSYQVEDSTYSVNGVITATKKLGITVPTSGYIAGTKRLQLSKVSF